MTPATLLDPKQILLLAELHANGLDTLAFSFRHINGCGEHTIQLLGKSSEYQPRLYSELVQIGWKLTDLIFPDEDDMFRDMGWQGHGTLDLSDMTFVMHLNELVWTDESIHHFG